MDAKRMYRLARKLWAFGVIILHGCDLSLVRIALATARCQFHFGESSMFSTVASIQEGPRRNDELPSGYL
jgi:hypothetical protein